jgi:hypothetical protein
MPMDARVHWQATQHSTFSNVSTVSTSWRSWPAHITVCMRSRKAGEGAFRFAQQTSTTAFNSRYTSAHTGNPIRGLYVI